MLRWPVFYNSTTVESTRKFVVEEMMPVVPHHDETGEYPWEVLRKAFDLGIMNTTIPQEYGGIGALFNVTQTTATHITVINNFHTSDSPPSASLCRSTDIRLLSRARRARLRLYWNVYCNRW